MELAIIIYLISLFGKLSSFLIVLGFLSILPILALYVHNRECSRFKAAELSLKRGALFILFVWFLGSIVPDERTSYTMLAAYGVTEVATNERVQEIAGNSLDLLEQTIKEYTESKESKE